jgi:periplasmic divalent cation tolerance protein
MTPANADAVRLVLMTAPDGDSAERIVHALVEARLAACGNIVSGVTSIYRWQDAVRNEREVLVLLKTTAAALPALLERAVELHPYEVPELIALPVEDGFAGYLDWVRASCRSERSKD